MLAQGNKVMPKEGKQEKVLFVDDEPNLLSGMKRQLRSHFRVYTADSGLKGLESIRDHGPFPVVVSDMRMPQMDGATFLAKVRAVAPHTTRMLLTGQTDIESAVSAINEGQIFRFLLKPCPTDALITIIKDGVDQYRLVTAEKELLEKTLRGSIKVLTDILSLVNPIAFGRSARSRKYVSHMSAKLKLPGRWQYDLAAMLSQIGCVTIPNDILEKVYSKSALASREQEIYNAHPQTAHDLITKIPRLHVVAQIIQAQKQTLGDQVKQPLEGLSPVLLGGQLIAIALEVDKHISTGDSMLAAISHLKRYPQKFHSKLLELLDDMEDIEAESVSKMVSPTQMKAGMVIDEDIVSEKGLLIAARGQEVTDAMAVRLKAMAENKELKDIYRVIVNAG